MSKILVFLVVCLGFSAVLGNDGHDTFSLDEIEHLLNTEDIDAEWIHIQQQVLQQKKHCTNTTCSFCTDKFKPLAPMCVTLALVSGTDITVTITARQLKVFSIRMPVNKLAKVCTPVLKTSEVCVNVSKIVIGKRMVTGCLRLTVTIMNIPMPPVDLGCFTLHL